MVGENSLNVIKVNVGDANEVSSGQSDHRSWIAAGGSDRGDDGGRRGIPGQLEWACVAGDIGLVHVLTFARHGDGVYHVPLNGKAEAAGPLASIVIIGCNR